jgi:hypothetical protein
MCSDEADVNGVKLVHDFDNQPVGIPGDVRRPLDRQQS